LLKPKDLSEYESIMEVYHKYIVTEQEITNRIADAKEARIAKAEAKEAKKKAKAERAAQREKSRAVQKESELEEESSESEDFSDDDS
jgi:hypothetical protein